MFVSLEGCAIEMKRQNCIKRFSSVSFDLQQAIVERNLVKVNQLLDKLYCDKTLDIVKFIGNATPLSLAIYTNQEDVVQLILGYPCNLNRMSRDSVGRVEPPLCSAVRLGQKEIVGALLGSGNGIDVNQVDFFGQTPLWLAVKGRRLDLVKLLVTDRGFRVNHPSFTRRDTSPLYLSVKYLKLGRHEIAEYLLQAGMPFACVDKDVAKGSSVAFQVAFNHEDNLLMVKLINAGMKPRVLRLFAHQQPPALLKETVDLCLPLSLKSQARMVLRRYVTSTQKPVTSQAFSTILPLLPNQLIDYVIELS